MSLTIVELTTELVIELDLDERLVELCKHVNKPAQDQPSFVYLFAGTIDTQEEVFYAALNLYEHGYDDYFGITSGEGKGFPGYEIWSSEVDSLLGQKRTVPVQGSIGDPMRMHTGYEAASLISFVDEQSLSDTAIVSSYIHGPRSLATTVSRIIETESEMQLYSYPGIRADGFNWWEEKVIESQGIQSTRKQFLKSELLRIAGPEKFSNIADLDTMFSYFSRLQASEGTCAKKS